MVRCETYFVDGKLKIQKNRFINYLLFIVLKSYSFFTFKDLQFRFVSIYSNQ
jgi:hypothetical protein